MVSKIKILRVTKGLNQQELAESLGVTQGAVSQWELGISQPSNKMLPRLAKVLECAPEDLMPAQLVEKSG
ncbi:MAG: helix-turn-helix transcriptional regulator [Clostridia bacterium]|nr:helix-turn-helix transcriptional regulator [Clostridia bacterium]